MDVVVSYIIPVIHVIACLFLIGVVLLQQGKGADVGAVFGGGSSQSLFGASGAGNFLTRLTTGMAIAFMVTSLVLTYGQSQALRSGIVDRIPESAGIPAPTPAPATDTAAAGDAAKPADAPAATPLVEGGTPPPAADTPPPAAATPPTAENPPAPAP